MAGAFVTFGCPVGTLTPSIQARWPHLDLFEEDYHWTVIRQGGHCIPAAAPQHIAEAEQRLGTSLTASYRAYVRECVQLSERLAEVNCVFLLNPARVFETGEWEARFMAA
jgi:hypothetical protein